MTSSPLDFSDLRDGPRDECGVFGIVSPGRDVARMAYFALYALQHRGQESAGIATAQNGHIMAMRDQGLVNQVFDEQKLRALQGDMAVGHVRYSTTGASSWENAQPVWRADRRELALAHNGNLINAVTLHGDLRESGVAFRSTSDSEIIAALLSTHHAATIEDAVADVMTRVEGAYSTVVMTKDRVVAFRDPAGLRPLSLGMLGEHYCVASESCAFDIIGARFLRDVQPGEVVSLTEDGIQTRQAVPAAARRCASSSTSTSRGRTPGSRGEALQVARGRMGEILAREAPVEADLVIPVPDSGNPAARGFARATGLPQDDGLIKNRYVARTFIQPGPGAAQSRPADEVQPAARGRGRPAPRGGRRLDRARQHHTPDRRDAARRRGGRGPHAHLRAADPPPLPLRDRHVDPRGDDRPRPYAGRGGRRAGGRLAGATCRWAGIYEAIRATRETHCDACFSGEYPLDADRVRERQVRARGVALPVVQELARCAKAVRRTAVAARRLAAYCRPSPWTSTGRSHQHFGFPVSARASGRRARRRWRVATCWW